MFSIQINQQVGTQRLFFHLENLRVAYLVVLVLNFGGHNELDSNLAEEPYLDQSRRHILCE
jgi:hypothetical protein